MFINQILDYIEYSFLKENYLVTFHDDLEKEKMGQFHVTLLIIMLSEIPPATILINHRGMHMCS